MCGISGIIDPHNKLGSLEPILEKAIKLLHRRGPDFNSKVVSSTGKWGLAHNRLSINDFSPQGHQPMVSHCNRYTMVFNGEIYNFSSLRRELESAGHKFHGRSDTEVALQSFSQWGIEKSLKKFSGMFAFAVIDHNENTLTLVKDPIGEKPLYYGLFEGTFLFASEPIFNRILNKNLSLNKTAIHEFLRLSYVPTPLCIFEGFHKLEPGTFLTIPLDNPDENHWHFSPYWSVDLDENQISHQEFSLSRLEEQLSDSIRQMMEMDAEFGCFLSGGVDSSLVASLMQVNSKERIHTFTVGFGDSQVDESQFAQKVASHLKTHHRVINFSENHLLDVVEEIPNIWREPFADSSQLPTFLVSKFASQYVKVCFSGDGGDETFGGYNRYQWLPKILHYKKNIPSLLLKPSLALLDLDATKKSIGIINQLRGGKRIQLLENKIDKFCRGLRAPAKEDLYLQTVWTGHNLVLAESSRIKSALSRHSDLDFQDQMMRVDLTTYLLDDILVKVDRASMANSLEVRVPFLHRSIVKTSLVTSWKNKIVNCNGKHPLKEILKNHLPEHLWQRPKSGFSIPLNKWLRNGFKSRILDLVNSPELQGLELFTSTEIHSLITNFFNSNRVEASEVWNLFILDLWLKQLR